MNENEKVRKCRIYRVLYALNEKTKVYAVNYGISLLWYAICGTWSLIG